MLFNINFIKPNSYFKSLTHKLGYSSTLNDQTLPELSFNVSDKIQVDLKTFINYALKINRNCEMTIFDPLDSDENIISSGIRFSFDANSNYQSVLCGIKTNTSNLNYTRCLFLDRDGILIQDTGYPHEPSKLIYRDELIPIIQLANQKNIPVIVITNQSGLARGIFNQEQYYNCQTSISNYFKNHLAMIDHWYHCPYLLDAEIPIYKKNSIFRKPKPGMILNAFEHYLIDLENSLMVGDKASDHIELIGLQSIIVDKTLKCLKSGSDLIQIVQDKF
jgi:D-glycero-D-manno-heptose 1,7-bisphosphate phosphatase